MGGAAGNQDHRLAIPFNAAFQFLKSPDGWCAPSVHAPSRFKVFVCGDVAPAALEVFDNDNKRNRRGRNNNKPQQRQRNSSPDKSTICFLPWHASAVVR